MMDNKIRSDHFPGGQDGLGTDDQMSGRQDSD